jgi:3-hydroxyisobutyrate dehydrogenase
MASSSAQTVGFIGLGNMGSHMAKNVMKAGHKVIAFDVNSSAIDALKAQGDASSASSPAEVAAGAQTLITMLPSNPHVLKVYLDSKVGVLSEAGSRPGSLLIDCSTCEPAVSQEVAAAAVARGSTYVDAPVSGGTIGADQATLTFMVGAPTEVSFKQAEALLQHLGKKVVHCGDVGMGQAAKLCNNLVLGISMAAVCEGHALGGRLGIDQKVLADILNTSSGRCWSSDTYNPCPGVMDGVPSARGYTGGFACDLMVKDLGLANAAANSAQPRLGLPMGGLAMQLYTLMSQHGGGGKDFSGLFEFLREGEGKK